jgi:arylsulfatase A-like enzyme
LDLTPTLLELAGAAPPDRALDGVSLAPLLLHGESLGRRRLFWNGKAMRDGRWKLILAGRGGPEVGLYELTSDLGETTNLAALHPSRVRRMQAALGRWQVDVAADATEQAP